MKILHVFSMAGVAEILSKECQELGHQSFVVQMKSLDPFGFGEHYGNTVYFDDYAKLLEATYKASFEADYIILHDFIEFYNEFPKNKLILYFHGTKLRNILQNDPEFHRIIGDFRVIVSTSDLLEILPEAFYLRAPCDRSLFTKQNISSDKWLTINRDYQKEYIEPKIRTRYPQVEYRNRQEKIIPYNQMPQLLSQYGNYVDWKFDYSKPDPKTIQALSCTAIQALSCGLKVWDYNGLEVDPMLLLNYDSKNVAKRFIEWLDPPN